MRTEYTTTTVDTREFTIKDSGERARFDSGMVRDTEAGKVDFTNLLHGPMLVRWAEHLTKAKAKYEDVAPGVPNWTLATGPEELHRYRRSAFRHMLQWLAGETDEDHAAAVMFNINGAEHVKAKMRDEALLMSALDTALLEARLNFGTVKG